MLPFSKARQIAETWVAVMTDGDAEIVREAVETKPYGWIFGFQSSEYLRDPSNISAALAGNAPFIVNRINGEIRVLGIVNFEETLSEYERSLPRGWRQFGPEYPKWD